MNQVVGTIMRLPRCVVALTYEDKTITTGTTEEVGAAGTTISSARPNLSTISKCSLVGLQTVVEIGVVTTTKRRAARPIIINQTITTKEGVDAEGITETTITINLHLGMMETTDTDALES